jgi:large subunit ribosomal protein L19
VVRSGRVRRAKLYYLRSRQGRAARIAERGLDTKASKAGEAPAVGEVVATDTLPVS